MLINVTHAQGDRHFPVRVVGHGAKSNFGATFEDFVNRRDGAPGRG
jgi:hypothetical protein